MGGLHLATHLDFGLGSFGMTWRQGRTFLSCRVWFIRISWKIMRMAAMGPGVAGLLWVVGLSLTGQDLALWDHN
ncbi:hypothetical protein X474_02530 [Dethiosulfatarculus sandiegensis]|uniref:Uncharacterized protein n=2 Tax=Dethiosulfatarculus sandiegensis TaxID=1429043 RepID=A0A0D2GLX9_9BACT|nr:hypothetical protein X474_02530 [Dethiosulfatarculus sandiegensis]